MGDTWYSADGDPPTSHRVSGLPVPSPPLARRRMLGLSAAAVGLAAAGVAGCGPATGGTNASGTDASGTNGSGTNGGGTGASGTGGGTDERAAGAGSAPPGRVSAPPANGVLAANVNQNLADTNFAELRKVSATWLRGFYPMDRADRGDVANQPAMRKLLTAADHGYGTLLSLKFDYKQGLPAAGSPEMNAALQRLDKVLDAVVGKVDILGIGNEPFIECSKTDRASATINEFYEALAQHTVTKVGHGTKTQLYMGALTDLEHTRTPQTDRWLAFVKNNPALAGTDCHPHVASLEQGQQYLSYILPRIRPDQKVLATEFSLVKLFRMHLSDPAPAAFANRHGLPANTPVWQVVRQAIEHPFPQHEWNDFLSANPWFAQNKQFLTDMMGALRQNDRCAVAAYGISQDTAMTKDFGPKSSPWVFNSLFCPRTVQPGADGLPGQNVTWSTQFRALQHT